MRDPVKNVCLNCGIQFIVPYKDRIQKSCSHKCGATWSRWREPIKRFWSKVDKRSPSECWSWRGGCNHDGYGNFCFRGKPDRAHRVAFIITTGKSVTGKVVRHRCDNPPCVNPGHLEIGTQQDNIRDMIRRGRHVAPRGERSSLAKLTWSDVREIRSSFTGKYGQKVFLAKRYGVSRCAIYKIL